MAGRAAWLAPWRGATLAAAALGLGVALLVLAQDGHVARCPAGQAGCPLGRGSGGDALSLPLVLLAGALGLAAIAALTWWRQRGPVRAATAPGGVGRLRPAR